MPSLSSDKEKRHPAKKCAIRQRKRKIFFNIGRNRLSDFPESRFFIYLSRMDSTEERAGLCALNRIFGFEPRIAHALLGHFGSAAEIFRTGGREIDEILGPYSRYRGSVSHKALEQSAEEIDRIKSDGITFIGISDPDYPALMKECEDAPVGLYIRSTTPVREIFSRNRKIAVVGTRDISPYGQEWCRKIVESMAESADPPLIISGLALGTDICAHKTAVESGIPTIGIMATGPEAIYPYRHRAFAEQMTGTPGCALVTDYPPGTAPLAIHFLRRNRIIAGLSEATILIESKTKGGGMMTARLAFSYSRDVYALSGRADDLRSQGCNMLIREKIAEPVTDIESLHKSLGLTCPQKRSRPDIHEILNNSYKGTLNKEHITMMAELLLSIRNNRGLTIEEHAGLTGIGFSQTSSLARALEADGFITIDLMQRCCIKTWKYG